MKIHSINISSYLLYNVAGTYMEQIFILDMASYANMYVYNVARSLRMHISVMMLS